MQLPWCPESRQPRQHPRSNPVLVYPLLANRPEVAFSHRSNKVSSHRNKAVTDNSPVDSRATDSKADSPLDMADSRASDSRSSRHMDSSPDKVSDSTARPERIRTASRGNRWAARIRTGNRKRRIHTVNRDSSPAA
jgi:hypothetical protein